MKSYTDKELYNPAPKPRNCNTYVQTYQFGDYEPNKKFFESHRLSNVFEDNSPSKDIKRRTSPTNTSKIFFSDQNHNDSPKTGIKTFKYPRETSLVAEDDYKNSKKQSLYKIQDQPVTSFYQNDYKTNESEKKKIRYHSPDLRNLYQDKDSKTKLSLTAHERSQMDQKSNIFNSQKQKKYEQNSIKEKPVSQLTKWYNPRIQSSNTDEKKWNNLHTQASQVLPLSQTYQDALKASLYSGEKLTTKKLSETDNLLKQPAISSKKGSQFVASTSKWNEYDSVRDKKQQFINNEVYGSREDIKSNSFALNKLSDQELSLGKSLKAIKGYIPAENKTQISNTNAEKNLFRKSTKQQEIYTGIYSWKNHYKGRSSK